MESYLQPNIGRLNKNEFEIYKFSALRMGEVLYEKLEIRLDTPPASRLNNLEHLGEAMQVGKNQN